MEGDERRETGDKGEEGDRIRGKDDRRERKGERGQEGEEERGR